jgi:hypothetical protein
MARRFHCLGASQRHMKALREFPGHAPLPARRSLINARLIEGGALEAMRASDDGFSGKLWELSNGTYNFHEKYKSH